MKIYQYETGILLDKTDEEFESYSQVWDKRYGYSENTIGVELDLETAKTIVQLYVAKESRNAYGIVSEIEVSENEYLEIQNEIKSHGYFETTDYDADYSTENVVYSLNKNQENFIIKKGEK